MQDLIIENGRVVDWFSDTDAVTDISVKNGVITSVGKTSEAAKRRIDATGLLVVPGVIDSHMHASGWLARPEKSFKMLALAGVTTAMEMAGPLEEVKRGMHDFGSGITVGCLEMIRPGWNVGSVSPDDSELKRVIDDALSRGAFGVKLLGGHYPLTPETEGRLIKLCDETGTYLGIHAGSTEHGSNIEGVKELFEAAAGRPFHLAHANAYCRGNIAPVADEIALMTRLLNEHPEVDSESYLSPINCCSGKCIDGVPESGVTRGCLASRGYPATAGGLERAIKAGFARVHHETDDAVVLAEPDLGLKLWKERGGDISVSFTVNPPISSFTFAIEKRASGHFLCDSLCTDGGGIPRNVIIENGLCLVRFGAITLKEFVFKSSASAAALLGLKNKGKLVPGADADITVIDFYKQRPVHAFSMGRPTLLNGRAAGTGGTLLTTPKGAKAAKDAGLGVLTADMDALFTRRLNRFQH